MTRFDNTPRPWDIKVSIPYDEKDEFKTIPGARWSGQGGEWFVPREHQPKESSSFMEIGPHLIVDSRLAKHQQKGFELALRDSTGFMLNWDTGLGKTYGALALALAVRQAKPRVLVVCPAGGKKVWEDVGCEFRYNTSVFWPKATKSKWENTLRVDKDEVGHVTIVGYSNLERLFMGDGELSKGWDVIISDECHYLCNTANGRLEKAPKRTKLMFLLRDLNPSAYRIALSATPAADHPVDLWGQLEWMHPGRWGTFNKFVHYFHECSVDDLGHRVIGKTRNHDVFKRRFAAVAHSVRKEEIEMVPYEIKVVRGERDGWLLDERTIVMCDTHKEVERLALMFPEAVAFHGGQGVKKRLELIKFAKVENRPLITTMHCVKEAIDLTHWNRTIYPEASYQILPLLQSMGRTHRMNSTGKVTYEFHVRGPLEERKIARVVEKIKDIQKMIPAGMDLSTYLEKVYSQDAFEAELATIDLSGLEWEET